MTNKSKENIKKYLTEASINFQKAVETDSGELMWAVLTNCHSTIQGYQDAAELVMFAEQSKAIAKQLKKRVSK
jgi:3-methyladenine DNA glycosylase Tag